MFSYGSLNARPLRLRAAEFQLETFKASLRAGRITGLPRFARNDGDAGLVLERGSLNSGLCVVHCSVRPELGHWMNGSGGDSAG